jgi:hypothetical protein
MTIPWLSECDFALRPVSADLPRDFHRDIMWQGYWAAEPLKWVQAFIRTAIFEKTAVTIFLFFFINLCGLIPHRPWLILEVNWLLLLQVFAVVAAIVYVVSFVLAAMAMKTNKVRALPNSRTKARANQDHDCRCWQKYSDQNHWNLMIRNFDMYFQEVSF